MDLFLDPDARQPLTEQLYEQLRQAIISGRLLPGDRLVPSRQLAGQLSISRHTVTIAYSRLVAEGYAEGHAGGGSAVAPLFPALPEGARPAAALGPSRRFADMVPYYGPHQGSYRFDLRLGLPDKKLFPAAAWRHRVNAAIFAERRPVYGDPAGEIRLRQAIARWVARSRSVTASAETVLITNGAGHAIDLLARVLLEPGDCVVVEDPGYLPVVRLLGALGAKVVGVPVDDQGLVVDMLPPSARIAYVTPSHQFPLGMTMSMPRRRALLRWAESCNAAIIEDDYDTEFRYVDRPLEPIHRLDENGRVLYVRSFSKTFSPSVRLGFAVVPLPLVRPVAALRQLIDWHPPTAMQTAMADFIDDGLLDKHIRRSRRVYAERYKILTQALSGPLAEHLTAIAPNAGLHVATLLRQGVNENDVLAAAARHGIAIFGLQSSFHASQARQGLLIGFSAVSTTDLPLALRTLGDVLASLSQPASTAGPKSAFVGELTLR